MLKKVTIKLLNIFQVKEFACHDGSDYVPIDIDNDGKLTASDALKILQAAVGLI